MSFFDDFLDVVPPLTGTSHKGQHGRVAVIGGCSEFTGAPFFAAYSAMRAGADYGNVFCTKSAATVIKGYAPELIVHPYMVEESDFFPIWEEVDISDHKRGKAVREAVWHVEKWLEKASSVIVGPGLGQDPIMWDTAARVIQSVRERGLPLILDADAISVVARDPSLVKGYHRAILTPNVPELWRLADALGVEHGKSQPWESPDFAREVAKALGGPVLIAKGQKDMVLTMAGSELITASASGLGCPKRCGGQGDVLSGILGTTVSWAVAYSKREELDADEEVRVIAEAAVQSLQVIRSAAHAAFERMGRSLVASDIIECLPNIIEEHWPRCD